MFEYKMPMLMARTYLRQAKMKDNPNSKRGQEYLSPDEIPELLDEEIPQQLLMSAFRKYRR